MKKNYLAALCGAAAFLFPVLAGAQCTLCGTGADSIYEATSNVQLPGAVYNFTSFTIDTGVTVTVTGPQPLVIYCSGAVNIQGTITVKGDDGSPGITSSMAGAGGLGVAGGQQGGDGVYSASVGPLDGVAGSGAGSGGAGMQWSGGGGGGYSTYGDTAGTNGGFGGSPYGNAQINPYDAGSGGGGGSGGYACGGGGGGAGGGYISISSCNGIIIGASGMIDARGGNGGSDGTGNCGGGGGGSGGSVYLASPSIVNDGTINAAGGTGGASNVPGNPYYGTGANGADGRVRLDYSSLSGSGSVMPASGYTTASVHVVPVITNVTNITCYGDCNGSITAAGTGGSAPYTYSWAPGGSTTASVSNLCTGCYTVTITDNTGCSSDTTICLTQPTQLTMTTSFVDESTTGAMDGMASATPSGGTGSYTYTWLPNVGSTDTVSNLSAGNYTITVTDANGCSVSDTIDIGVFTGIGAPGNRIGVQVFPNPTNGNLDVNVNSPGAGIVIEIYNTMGQKVNTITRDGVSSVHETLDLSSLPEGIYWMRFSSGNNVTVKKITISR